MTNKEKYYAFCEIEKTIPLFSQAWWLDAVCADEWDVCLVEKGGTIYASMPFHIKKRYGFTILCQPPLTQNLGPWIKSSTLKYDKILSQQKVLMEGLIEQLPTYHYFNQNWHYMQTNWLPFYWKGFKQTTYYTYVIEELIDLEYVFSNFGHAKRKNINKAEKIINVVFDISAEEFYKNHKMTLAKQGLKISYSFELFNKIYKAGYEHNSARTIAGYDSKNNLHAALFIIWDELSAYDLISTIDPDYRVYGAASLLIKEVITFVSTITKKIDFEGSMIESVERSFRQFGAIQKPYFNVSKTQSKMLQIANCITKSFTG